MTLGGAAEHADGHIRRLVQWTRNAIYLADTRGGIGLTQC